MRKTSSVTESLDYLKETGLLSEAEARLVEGMFTPCFEFSKQLELADSIHLHIRVDDTDALPAEDFQRRGGRLDHNKPGYVKFCFPGGLNAIFSSIPVAQDNLAETEENRRPRPHVDHIGIDLRRETEEVKSEFERVPGTARELAWGHIPQGGKGRPVYCCHIEVAQKHWVYPPEGGAGTAIPLEFAFGPLKTSAGKAGCDLRPSSPVARPASDAKKPCCVS